MLHGALDSLNFQAESVLSSARDLMKKVYPSSARSSNVLKTPPRVARGNNSPRNQKKNQKQNITSIDGKPTEIVSSSGIEFESI